MSKKKKIVLILSALILVLFNVLILGHREPISGSYTFSMTLCADKPQEIQVFYSGDQQVSEKNSIMKVYEKVDEFQEITYEIPFYSNWIRLDLGKEAGDFKICSLTVGYKNQLIDLIDNLDLDEKERHQISKLDITKDEMIVATEGTDAYIWIPLETKILYKELENGVNQKTWILNILMLLFLDGGVLAAIIFRKKVFHLPIELMQNRALILNLAKNDFKTKYAGSYLGIFWAFVQPIVTILVYWFVFSVGLKSGKVDNYPFVLYLVSGIVPWFFFQDALNSGTNALIEYNYLVKKVVFKISILPIVKIVSALFVHVFFVTFSLILCWCYGYAPSIYTIQILYYSACTFLLSLGLVYATSAMVIFFRDLTQIISIVLQVGVWMTPIMWDLNMLAGNSLLMKLFKLNPMYYIVSGYRDSMLGKVWFWEHWGWTLYFWVIVAILFVLGTIIFKRLKPHFADVL